MSEQVTTQVAGNIWKVLVNVGDHVKAGDTLFILELMKTEVPHLAGVDGRVAAVNVAEGDAVDSDFVAVLIE